MTVPGKSAPGRTSDDDLFALATVGVLGLGAIGAAAALLWTETVAWLLAHSILLPAQQHPPIVLPYSAGAGLDLPRFAVAVYVLVMLIAVVTRAVARRPRRDTT